MDLEDRPNAGRSIQQHDYTRENMSSKIETPEQAAERRAAGAKRKRIQRAKAREEKLLKTFKEEISMAETLTQFWAASVKTIDPEKLAAWAIINGQVLDQMWFIQTRILGTFNEAQTLALDATLPEDQQTFISVEDGDEDLRSLTARATNLCDAKSLALRSTQRRATTSELPSPRRLSRDANDRLAHDAYAAAALINGSCSNPSLRALAAYPLGFSLSRVIRVAKVQQEDAVAYKTR
jgi:hypothetical protein